MRALPRPPLALLALAALAAAGCSSAPNVASAVDYARGVRVVAIEEFADDSKVKEEQTIFYNTKTEEGRRMAAQARTRERPGRFTLAVAHNVAIRLRESADAMRAAGMSVPVVVAYTSAYPRGVVATGAGSFGTALERAPADLPPPEVRVRGAVRFDVSRDAFEQLIRGSDLGRIVPGDRLEAAADVTIEQGGETQRQLVAFVGTAAASDIGIGYESDPGAQLVARVADMLAPTRLRMDRRWPLAFVRRVVDERTVEVDLGLERRAVHVTDVQDLEQPLAEPRTREDLERAIGRQYVRLRWKDAPEAPAKTLWKRVSVEEASPE